MPHLPHLPAAAAPEHAELVVALDAGDLAGAELTRAGDLLAACPGCAALREDLAAIRVSMTSLPTPPRRRDYRLTDADAARLRPTGWRRLVGWLAAPGSTVRPLATGLATLGVVGLLLTAGLPGLVGGAAVYVPVGDQAGGATAPEGAVDPLAGGPQAPGADPSAAPQPGELVEPTPAASEDVTIRTSGQPDEWNGNGTAGEKTGFEATDLTAGPSAPFVLSLILLAAGVGLLLARAIALRRAA